MGWTSGTLIGSVQRALRLLDVVAESPRPITVKALANRVGLNLGTTYNLVRTLIHEGYLRGDSDGLLLGPRFPSLQGHPSSRVFLARIRYSLKKLSEDLGAASYLSTYRNGEIETVDIVDSPRHPRVPLWVGIHDSAHATALGKQILATLEPRERQDYLSRHELPELTRNTISSRRSLLRHLESAGEVMLDQEEYAIGTTCVAVPVRTPSSTGAIAISLSSSDPRVQDLEPITRRLKSAAADLSLALGVQRLTT